MILTISKAPQFGESGEVVVGQCEAHTDGWRLRLVEKGREEEVLMEGTYLDLRCVQRLCSDAADADEVRRIVEEAKEAVPLEEEEALAEADAGSDAEDKDETQSTQILDREEIQRAMKSAGGAEVRAAGPAKGARVSRPGASGRAPVPVRPEETGVLVERIAKTLVVRFVDPELAAHNCDTLAVALGGVLEQEAGRIVLDLSLAVVLSSRLIREIVRMRERASELGRAFALVIRRREVISTLGSMNLVGFLPVFSDLDTALKGT